MQRIKIEKKKGIVFAVGVLLVIAVFLYLFIGSGQLQKLRDLRRFSKAGYNGAFLSMYDISAYNEDDFTVYRGVPTVKAGYTIQKWSDFSQYLAEIFSSDNTVTNIYLGVDPMILWERSERDETKWTEDLERYLLPYVTANPEVSYEILLPAFSLQYWAGLEPAQMSEHLEVFKRFIEDMYAYENVSVYFMGGERWLIANPGNYLKNGQTNSDVSRKMFLHVFCDHNYQITPENASVLLERLYSQVEQEWEEPAEYPDLSQWCIVFFGDSVLAYYQGSYSMSGVVGSLSGAQVYNCGEGGIAASGNPAEGLNFNSMANRFLNQDTVGLNEKSNFVLGLKDFMQESHKGKKYCFVIEYGLNDYFSGRPVENSENPYDVETYAGALRSGILALQASYPDAEILVLAPTYTASFSGGTEINSDMGGVLTDYVDAALQVAKEMGVYHMNNYADSGINADNHEQYLADQTHPNETGAFLLGTEIVEYMGNIDENK